MTMVRIEFDISDTTAVQKVHHLLGGLLGFYEPVEIPPRVVVEAPALEAPAPEAPAPAKRTRRTKAEIEAAKAPADPPPVQVVEPAPPPVQPAIVDTRPDLVQQPAAPSFLDDDEPGAATVTKDDVRAALVALQMKRTGVYVQGGMIESAAAAKAEADARNVIVTAGGTDRLGTLDPAKYGAVVKAANEEAAK
jgi:hypothetical protein